MTVITVTGCFGNSNDKGNQNINQAVNKSNPELEKKYEKELKAILKPVWQDTQVNNIKDQILELRAPAKYLNLHLNLVLAFEEIEKGQALADQAQIESGLEKLNDLKKQYPWMD